MAPNRTLKVILVSALMLGGSLGGAAQAVETASTGTASTEGAAAFIETLGAQVLKIQDSGPADLSGTRLASLRDLIRSGFDLDLTSQLVLGKFWSRATPERRATFSELFARYLLNTYARHLDAYRIDTLEIVASNRAGERDFLVQTSIERDGEVASAVWRVRARDGAYSIIDVLIDGISLTLTQRSEFASVIVRKGFDGMLAVLRQRVTGQSSARDAGLRVALPASILISPNASKINLLLSRH